MTRVSDETDDGKLISAERVEVKGKVAVFREGDVSATSRATSTRPSAPWRRSSPLRLAMCVFTNYGEGEGDDGPLIERTPVVAWRITGNGAVPVSRGEGVPWFSDAFGVLLPDGRIVMASVSALPQDDEKS